MPMAPKACSTQANGAIGVLAPRRLHGQNHQWWWRRSAVPALPAGARTGYVKFCPRSAEDKPLIGAAALLVLDPATGRCRDARIALAGAAPTAIRSTRAEASLRQAPLDDGAIEAAAETAAAEADPLSDLMGSADYRRRMVRVWVRRLLVRLRDSAPAS